MPFTWIDAAFAFTLVVLASLFEHYWFWPRFKKSVATGEPMARIRGYRRGIIGQWLFTAGVLAMWVGFGRPFSALLLTEPAAWRIWVGIALIVATIVLAYLQLASVRRLPAERRVAVRPRLASIAFLIPQRPDEYRWFLALSLTAGVCEELLYRGYLTWLLAPWLGVPAAMFVVVIAFGLGHSYQGRRGAIRATLAGAVMAGVVLATGWLVPAMIIHALVDASSGTAGYWLFRDDIPASSGGRPSDAPAPTADSSSTAGAAYQVQQ